MNFTIEILNVAAETKTTTTGKPYVMLDVAFKNQSTGKIEGKKLLPFGEEAVYKAFKDAKAGNVFEIEAVKGEKYWEWKSAKQMAPGITQTAAKATPAPKSTYETPEERAKKQVFIVKQSSISNALTLLSLGAKTPPTTQQVIDVAQVFTDWVLSSPSAPDNSYNLQEDEVVE